MHIKRYLAAVLVLGMLLSGCGMPQDVDQLFESDTIVYIPVIPTEETTVPETIPAATQPPTETAEQPEETEPPKSGGTKSGGTKTSSGSKSPGKASKPAATLPPETLPPETLPPETVPPQLPVFDVSAYVPGGLEYAVAEQINGYRLDAGLAPLNMDAALCGIASVRAYEVMESWSHTRPDGSDWQTALTEYGYFCSAAGEMLAHSDGFDGAAVAEKWMNAESSKAELLNPAFTTIGVGIWAEDGLVFLAAILIG